MSRVGFSHFLVPCAFACCALTGCFELKLPKSPAQGGPAWEEIATDHFTIETNWDDTEATRLAREFEVGQRVMMKLAFGGQPPPRTRIRVFALSHAEFSHFSDRGGLGGLGRFEPVVYWGGGADWGALHELGHAISMSFVRDQPRWFAEGIAMYLQMIRYNERTGEAELGRCPPDLRFVTRQDLMSLEDQWSWSPSERHTPRESRHYATSWTIVHYLLDERPEQFRAFEQALSHGQEPRRAWQAIFPDLDSQGFKEATRKYLAGFKCEMQKANIPVASMTIQRRPLDDANVLGLRAWLYMEVRSGGDRSPGENARLARENIRQALAEDAASFWPNLVNAVHFKTLPESKDSASRVVAGEPDNWLAWVWYDDALRAMHGSLDERRAALDKATVLAPGNDWVRFHLERLRAEGGVR